MLNSKDGYGKHEEASGRIGQRHEGDEKWDENWIDWNENKLGRDENKPGQDENRIREWNQDQLTREIKEELQKISAAQDAMKEVL